MISVFQKTTNEVDEGWVDTIKFSEGYVRDIFLKQRKKIEIFKNLLSKRVFGNITSTIEEEQEVT